MANIYARIETLEPRDMTPELQLSELVQSISDIRFLVETLNDIKDNLDLAIRTLTVPNSQPATVAARQLLRELLDNL
jgi:hypothetical protein